jgi:CRISPR system Cascade subunit CasE
MSDVYFTTARLSQTASARAILSLLDPRDPGRALDAHHKLIWSLFADIEGDAKRDFLWRYDQGVFNVLSTRKPHDAHRLFDTQTRTIALAFVPGQHLKVRLRVNATISRGGGSSSSTQARSSRHDVVMDRMRQLRRDQPDLSQVEAREQAVPLATESWLQRRGSSDGFSLDSIVATSYGTVEIRNRKREGHSDAASKAVRPAPVKFGVLDIDAIIQVTEPDAFQAAVRQGFGRGKAFGFGLMLIDTA